MAAGLTVEQAIQAIYQEFGAPPIADDEFTERMYSDMIGVPSQTASRQLLEALKAGRVVRRQVLCNGKRCWGYKMADGFPP